MQLHPLLLSAAMLVSACGDDSSTQNDAGSTDADAPCSATIDLLDFRLDPKELELDSGKITLCAINKGKTPHDLAVRDLAGKTLGKTKVLNEGDEDQFTVTLSAATYAIYCTQGGHESLGMKGTLTLK